MGVGQDIDDWLIEGDILFAECTSQDFPSHFIRFNHRCLQQFNQRFPDGVAVLGMRESASSSGVGDSVQCHPEIADGLAASSKSATGRVVPAGAGITVFVMEPALHVAPKPPVRK